MRGSVAEMIYPGLSAALWQKCFIHCYMQLRGWSHISCSLCGCRAELYPWLYEALWFKWCIQGYPCLWCSSDIFWSICGAVAEVIVLGYALLDRQQQLSTEYWLFLPTGLGDHATPHHLIAKSKDPFVCWHLSMTKRCKESSQLSSFISGSHIFTKMCLMIVL